MAQHSPRMEQLLKQLRDAQDTAEHLRNRGMADAAAYFETAAAGYRDQIMRLSMETGDPIPPGFTTPEVEAAVTQARKPSTVAPKKAPPKTTPATPSKGAATVASGKTLKDLQGENVLAIQRRKLKAAFKREASLGTAKELRAVELQMMAAGSRIRTTKFPDAIEQQVRASRLAAAAAPAPTTAVPPSVAVSAAPPVAAPPPSQAVTGAAAPSKAPQASLAATVSEDVAKATQQAQAAARAAEETPEAIRKRRAKMRESVEEGQIERAVRESQEGMLLGEAGRAKKGQTVAEHRAEVAKAIATMRGTKTSLFERDVMRRLLNRVLTDISNDPLYPPPENVGHLQDLVEQKLKERDYGIGLKQERKGSLIPTRKAEISKVLLALEDPQMQQELRSMGAPLEGKAVAWRPNDLRSVGAVASVRGAEGPGAARDPEGRYPSMEQEAAAEADVKERIRKAGSRKFTGEETVRAAHQEYRAKRLRYIDALRGTQTNMAGVTPYQYTEEEIGKLKAAAQEARDKVFREVDAAIKERRLPGPPEWVNKLPPVEPNVPPVVWAPERGPVAGVLATGAAGRQAAAAKPPETPAMAEAQAAGYRQKTTPWRGAEGVAKVAPSAAAPRRTGAGRMPGMGVVEGTPLTATMQRTINEMRAAGMPEAEVQAALQEFRSLPAGKHVPEIEKALNEAIARFKAGGGEAAALAGGAAAAAAATAPRGRPIVGSEVPAAGAARPVSGPRMPPRGPTVPPGAGGVSPEVAAAARAARTRTPGGGFQLEPPPGPGGRRPWTMGQRWPGAAPPQTTRVMGTARKVATGAAGAGAAAAAETAAAESAWGSIRTAWRSPWGKAAALGGLILGGPYISKGIRQLRGADQESIARNEALMTQMQMAPYLAQVAEAEREFQMKRQLQIEAAMLKEYDPITARLLMGLPDTTDSEGVIGGQSPRTDRMESFLRQRIENR